MAKQKDITSQSTKKLLGRLWREYILNFKQPLILALVFMVITAAAEAGTVYLLKPLFDQGFLEKNMDILTYVAVAIVVVSSIKSISMYIQAVKINKVGLLTINELQKEMLSSILKQDNYFYEKHPSGTLLSRFTADATLIRNSIIRIVSSAIKDLFTIIFMLGVMLYQSWQLTIIAVIVLPLAGKFIAHFGRKLRSNTSMAQKEISHLSYNLEQVIQGVKVVKSYCMEIYEKSKINKIIDKIFKLSYRGIKFNEISRPVVEVLGVIAFAAIVYISGYMISSGTLTTGEMASFFGAVLGLYRPIKSLSSLNMSMQEGLAGIERVFEVLDAKVKIKEKSGAKDIKFEKPKIEFKKATFVYSLNSQKVFEHLNLKFPSNKTTALVGLSGAGKSTILNLIPRFYDLKSGKITINGHNIKDLSLKSLRSQIALVSQDIILFDDTVANNIKYGAFDKDVTKSQIIEAAKKVNLHTFISNLPRGYNTVIGERGSRFSGGQKQRLSIARAMIKNAPILLLDEATSSLDNESEKIIQHSLDELMKDKTTIVVAHRLSTIINADKIMVLREGKIVEEGTHKSLLKKNGFYKKLYTTQFENQ
jgi:subfamily B ATP-binding cassette protein MsbA